MILEHDAIFTRQFKSFDFEGGAISINNPDALSQLETV